MPVAMPVVVSVQANLLATAPSTPALTEEATPLAAVVAPIEADSAPVVVAPAPVVAAPIAVPAPVVVGGGMPRIQAYILPVEEMHAIAQASGLQWVNSDPAKIAAVQAAIAAEPRPVHVPRERPALVVLDEGPLVLVETNRDLRDLQLPFDLSPQS